MRTMHHEDQAHPPIPGGSRAVRRPVAKAAPPRRVTPCQSHGDPELWFAQGPTDVEKAKQLCTDCPVKAACLGSALDRAEPWGVWGGELLVSGAVVAKKRGRGRPRKNPATAA